MAPLGRRTAAPSRSRLLLGSPFRGSVCVCGGRFFRGRKCDKNLIIFDLIQDGPKSAQDAPRGPQDRLKVAQDGPKSAQDGPQMDPSWPQERPRCPQERPKTSKSSLSAPNPPEMPSRAPKIASRPPKMLHEIQKSPQDTVTYRFYGFLCIMHE